MSNTNPIFDRNVRTETKLVEMSRVDMLILLLKEEIERSMENNTDSLEETVRATLVVNVGRGTLPPEILNAKSTFGQIMNVLEMITKKGGE